MAVKPVPEGYHSVTPYLLFRKQTAQAIEYYKKVFGAEELMRMPAPGDAIGHAELKIGDSHIMMADEHPDMKVSPPVPGAPAGSFVMLYVPDVDAAFARAVSNGGKELRALKDEFYGDRSATVVDPFGHVWVIATHVEDVPPEEMERRAAAAHKG